MQLVNPRETIQELILSLQRTKAGKWKMELVLFKVAQRLILMLIIAIALSTFLPLTQ
jgi:hypothetical protein